MYKPEINIDNKELVPLPEKIWEFTIGDIVLVGRQITGHVIGTEIIAMKYARLAAITEGFPLFYAVHNIEIRSTINLQATLLNIYNPKLHEKPTENIPAALRVRMRK